MLLNVVEDLDRDSPTPLYVQLAAVLRARIVKDDLSRLPSYVQLCQQYQVSRPTAESAVKLLIEAGEAVVAPGKGVFVVRRDA